jgi:hypothetical protein
MHRISPVRDGTFLLLSIDLTGAVWAGPYADRESILREASSEYPLCEVFARAGGTVAFDDSAIPRTIVLTWSRDARGREYDRELAMQVFRETFPGYTVTAC